MTQDDRIGLRAGRRQRAAAGSVTPHDRY